MDWLIDWLMDWLIDFSLSVYFPIKITSTLGPSGNQLHGVLSSTICAFSTIWSLPFCTAEGCMETSVYLRRVVHKAREISGMRPRTAGGGPVKLGMEHYGTHKRHRKGCELAAMVFRMHVYHSLWWLFLPVVVSWISARVKCRNGGIKKQSVPKYGSEQVNSCMHERKIGFMHVQAGSVWCFMLHQRPPGFFFLLLLMPVYLVYLRSREYELATLTRSQFIQNGTVENPFQVDESHVIR